MILVTITAARRAAMKPFNLIYCMMNQNTWMASRKVAVFAVFVVVLYIVYLFEDYRQEPNRYLKSTSKKYCNYPPETGNDEGFLDLPGTFADNPFSLKMVQIVFRHGDRAPLLQNLPNTDRKVFDCSLDSHNIVIDHLFLDLKEMVKYINIRGLSPQVSQHPLLPDSREKFCKAGQLTVQGFLQLIAIGKHLRRQYKDLLNGLKGNEISVLSTNYDRTVQSAVAFLYGLLTKEGAMKAKKLVINVTTDNWFGQRDDGSVMPCPALHKVTAKNKQSSEYVDGAQNLEVIMNHVSKLVDIPRPQLPTVILLADQVLTRLCHNHPLPCGPRGCISEKDAGALYNGAVWSFQHNYSAPSQILSHPLLVQITTRMLMKSDERTLNKFVLYSTHDSTLSALLLFMGLFDGDWLHYGTRVVFELWGKKMFRNSKDDKSPLENYMIRILVNGKVVTHKVNFCGGKLQFKEFCPAEELLKLLSKAGPNGMKEYYRHMCEELI